MKTYKVWAQQTTFLYAYVEAESEEKAWDLALQKDGSEFTEKGDGPRLAGYNETDCSQRHRRRILGRTQVYEFHVQMSAMPQKRKEIEAAAAAARP